MNRLNAYLVNTYSGVHYGIKTPGISRFFRRWIKT